MSKSEALFVAKVYEFVYEFCEGGIVHVSGVNNEFTSHRWRHSSGRLEWHVGRDGAIDLRAEGWREVKRQEILEAYSAYLGSLVVMDA